MDVIKWRDKWVRLPPVIRNGILTETVDYLESEERPKCKPEHLSHLINFETELQGFLNVKKIPESWFTQSAQTYGSFPFYAAVIRRVL
jgi:hypothetical protein